jgi:hypothetical protein
VLRYFSGNDRTSMGSWTQKDDHVKFDVNNYSFHKGTIRGDRIEGESYNRDGRTWMLRIDRVKQLAP